MGSTIVRMFWHTTLLVLLFAIALILIGSYRWAEGGNAETAPNNTGEAPSRPLPFSSFLKITAGTTTVTPVAPIFFLSPRQVHYFFYDCSRLRDVQVTNVRDLNGTAIPSQVIDEAGDFMECCLTRPCP